MNVHVETLTNTQQQLISRHIAVISAIASEEHSVAIAIDGSVYAWGRGKYGKLGISNFETPDKEKKRNEPKKCAVVSEREMSQ